MTHLSPVPYLVRGDTPPVTVSAFKADRDRRIAARAAEISVALDRPQRRRAIHLRTPLSAGWREVVRLDSGERFPTIAQAARCAGVKWSALKHALRFGYWCNGVEWAYVKGANVPRRRKKNQAIRSLTTGVKYPSLTAAVGQVHEYKQFKRELSNLSRALRDGTVWRGQKWERVA